MIFKPIDVTETNYNALMTMTSLLHWAALASVAACCIGIAVTIALFKGLRIDSNVLLVLVGGSTAIFSASLTLVALYRFGPIGIFGWIAASIYLAYVLTKKSEVLGQRTRGSSAAYALSLVAGGLFIGSVVGGITLHFLDLA